MLAVTDEPDEQVTAVRQALNDPCTKLGFRLPPAAARKTAAPA